MSCFAFSSFWFGSHVRVGSSARQPSPFSLLRQRKGTKSSRSGGSLTWRSQVTRTPKATPLTGRLEADCPALLAHDGKGLELAPGTSLRQSPLLGRHGLRCSAVPKGPQSKRNTSSLRRCEASRLALAFPPVGAGEERRAGRDQKGRLSESRTRGEFEPLPRPDRAPQRTPRSGAAASGRLSLLTFFGEAKKVRRLSGRHPDAVQRVTADRTATPRPEVKP